MTQDYYNYPGPAFVFNIRFNILHRLLAGQVSAYKKTSF